MSVKMSKVAISALVDADELELLMSSDSVIATLPDIMAKLQAAYQAGCAHGNGSEGRGDSVAVAKTLMHDWDLADPPDFKKVSSSEVALDETPTQKKTFDTWFSSALDAGYLRQFDLQGARAGWLASLAAHPGSTQVAKWIRVEDQLPEVEQFVLTFGGDAISVNGVSIARLRKTDGDSYWQNILRGDTFSRHVTHWMPLPLSPEKASQWCSVPHMNSLQEDLLSALLPFAHLCPEGVSLMDESDPLVKRVHLKDIHRAQQLIKYVALAAQSRDDVVKEST